MLELSDMGNVEGLGMVQHVGASRTLPVTSCCSGSRDGVRTADLRRASQGPRGQCKGFPCFSESSFRKQDVDSDFGVRSAVVPRFGARPRLEMPRGLSKVNSIWDPRGHL